MSLHEKIKTEMVGALKNKDAVKLSVLRGLIAAFTNEAIAQKKMPQEILDDDIVINAIKRAGKQRKDSIEQFKKGGREDLASSEEAELKIIEEYLPKMMGVEEIKKVAETKKAELGIDDKAKIGILVGAVMKEMKGQADGGNVKKVIEDLF